MSRSELLSRLANGGTVVVGEGYLFELERRGYLKAGAFVPEVVIEHPEVVRAVTNDFIHAGSDVALAMTYYGNREKMRLIGRENELERLNRKALEIAAEVAKETGTILAGNICNTTHYDPSREDRIWDTERSFKEQIEWALDAGMDYMVAETFFYIGEAMLALECIQKYSEVPAVVTMMDLGNGKTSEGMPITQALRTLEDKGAAVVGLNCCRGPASMLPVLRNVRKACKGPIACLPVSYRTSAEYPTMQSLINPFTGRQAFTADLPGMMCCRSEIADFAKQCKEIGVQYIGLCCGSSPHLLREVAQVYDRKPPASRFAPDMSLHYVFGDIGKQQETAHIKAATTARMDAPAS